MSHARTKRLTKITLTSASIAVVVIMVILELAFSSISGLIRSIIGGITSFQFDIIAKYFVYFMLGRKGEPGGLVLTFILAAGSLGIAFATGLVFGLMRHSKRWWLHYPAIVYIELVRGMPLILVIFWFVFLPPAMSDSLKSINRMYFAFLAFICFTGAYIAEIVRAGILSIGKGQMEAARSTGLTHAQAMFYIIMPQALKNMIPSFVNQFVSLIKDTSLVWFVGLGEFTTTIFQINNKVLVAPFELYFFAILVYFVICYPLTASSRWLERKLGVGQR
jgi:polar amino acid transport system permease protein